MPEIKDRPILFSAPVVRAILAGKKTMTRREVEKRAALDCLAAGFEPSFLALPSNSDLCPYSQPGDRLWVREAWAQINVAQAPGESWVVYRECDNRTDYGGPWKPSIHMRRRDSRILLEITSVRVERLQAISDEQCVAEDCGLGPAAIGLKLTVPPGASLPRAMFAEVWQSINGASAWDANPWVWVVEFKRVTP